MTGSTLDELHQEWLKRPGYEAAYDALEEEFAIASARIEASARDGLTHEEIAGRTDTRNARRSSEWHRSFATVELAEAKAQVSSDPRMDEPHGPLDRLLDDSAGVSESPRAAGSCPFDRQ